MIYWSSAMDFNLKSAWKVNVLTSTSILGGLVKVSRTISGSLRK